VAAPRVAFGQAAVAAAGGGPGGGSTRSPFAGSFLWYSHNVTGATFDRATQQTYNPMWAQQLTLRPQFNFHPRAFLVGQFTVSQEFTNSDLTTYRNEIEVSDAFLEAFWKGWKEPNTGVNVAASVRLILPTSKGAWSSSMVGGLAPTLRLVKGFDFLGGLTVIYFARASRFLHQYSTSQVFTKDVPCADLDVPSCSSFLHDGGRNVAWGLTQGPILALGINDQLSFSLLLGTAYQQLYSLTPASVPTDTGTVSLDAIGSNGVDARFISLFSFGASYQLNDVFSFTLSAYTFSGMLGLDGRYRNFVINPSTTLSLEVDIELEHAYFQFVPRPEPTPAAAAAAPPAN